jgi:hypothetical protein
MSDNFPLLDATAATRRHATEEVSFSGQTADVSLIRVVNVIGAEGSRTVCTFNAAHLVNANTGVISAAPAYFRGFYLGSRASARVYVKLYNQTSAPSLGGAGVVRTFPIQAGVDRDLVLPIAGLFFSVGIAYTITTGHADADSTGITAGELVGEFFYDL